MPQDTPKNWLYCRSLEKWCKQDLSPGDVNTIMEQCDNETKLLNTQPLVGIPSH